MIAHASCLLAHHTGCTFSWYTWYTKMTQSVAIRRRCVPLGDIETVFFSSWFHLLWFWMMSLGRRIARVGDRFIGFGFLVLPLQSRICGWSLSWKPLLGRALSGETPPYSGLLRVADLSKSPPHLVLATAISYNLSHPLPPLSILQQKENFI